MESNTAVKEEDIVETVFFEEVSYVANLIERSRRDGGQNRIPGSDFM